MSSLRVLWFEPEAARITAGSLTAAALQAVAAPSRIGPEFE
ncbi:hypothetical protein [Synechococcus sp. UW140]